MLTYVSLIFHCYWVKSVDFKQIRKFSALWYISHGYRASVDKNATTSKSNRDEPISRLYNYCWCSDMDHKDGNRECNSNALPIVGLQQCPILSRAKWDLFYPSGTLHFPIVGSEKKTLVFPKNRPSWTLIVFLFQKDWLISQDNVPCCPHL